MPNLARHLFAIAVLITLAPLAAAVEPVTRVVFGSCAGQDRPQPFWRPINALKPDLFLMLGDNVYANTVDPVAMRHVYAALGEQPGFRRLLRSTTVMATWDDHDFGSNDAGGDHPHKFAVQRVFLDFFGVPEDSPRRRRQGVYHAETFGPPGKRLQVIMLDTRYFRSELRRGRRAHTYRPSTDPEKTILGAEQWAWLAERLREPADLRLIGSSIQVVAEEQPFEKWANFPLERERLFEAIRRSGKAPVIILSGDRHHSELSVARGAVGYDLYDFTSSSFNKPYLPIRTKPVEVNKHRVGPVVKIANFAVMDIQWDAPIPSLHFEIRDSSGAVKFTHVVPAGRITPSGQ